MTPSTTRPTYVVETDDNGEPIKSNTPAWLLKRQTGLGASDGPAVLGLSPWQTPRDVYLDKRAESITDEQTEAMEFGHLMEPIAVELFRRRHGDSESTKHKYLGDIEPSPGLLRSTDHPILLASLDSVIVEPSGQRVPGQIKNVTVYKRGAWSDSEGGVPDYVRVQVVQECIVMGADHGWVLPIFGGNHMPEPIRVDVPDDYAEWWPTYSAEWWERHIVGGVEPVPTLGDDLADVFTAQIGLAVDLDDDTLEHVRRLVELKAAIKKLEDEKDEVALLVKTYLGDATEGFDRTDPKNPRLAVTWRQNRESAPVVRLNEELLLSDHPELADLLDAYRESLPGKRAARPLLTK